MPGRAEHPKKFRSLGITSITQNSRELFLLPLEESEAVGLLQKLVSQFPPASGTIFIDKVLDEKAVESDDAPPVGSIADELAPVDVREWLIEPDSEQLALVSLNDSLINE